MSCARGESLATLPHPGHYNINTELGEEGERALTIHTTQTMRIPAKITIIHTTYPGIYVANMEICTGLQYIIDNLSGESFFGPSNSDVDNPMKM